LGVNRSSFYYEAASLSEENRYLMRLIDEEYTRHPFYGYRKMTEYLQRLGFAVNGKRVLRLMRLLGLQALAPKPNLSKPVREHLKFPYLLRGLKIERVDQVWAADITYIRMRNGFLYLLAIMDWYSRFVLDIEISISLEAGEYTDCLQRSLKRGTPEIFNSDQGSQFTALEWIGILENRGILISMDSVGRCYDNIMIERLWRSVKYEEVYLKDYEDGWEAEKNSDV
jgi:putative transposase